MIIICIEGPDGTGKSTQVRRVAERLRRHGFKTYASDVPFDGPTKKIIYWMLHNGLAKRWPITFQMIHFLNRLYWQILRYKALSTINDVAVLGRWRMSSYIYGKLEGLPSWLLHFMKYCMHEPTFTFILMGSNRGHDRDDDCYEGDIDLQRRLRREFIEQRQITPNSYQISSDEFINDVTDQIIEQLNDGNDDDGYSLSAMLGNSWNKIT